ncbi:hypothetical protein [Streptomyces cavernicola]|uniref:SMI1/KNR4 family protein n=1 Tax=Streptomyces cavernicola TaxID=3043613 RepID=A0ABT6SMV7_9ACTN|nr:hypothetical protein [Streptomyces sp. B-S-A6]MDI3409164.1 hypothetical protein [Streptomyces sp. B-S-A6]
MTESRLAALLATGLVDRLDARDKRVLERRALLWGAGETPYPLDPRGWWFAVPGDAHEGIFEALGLHDRFPVTLYEGEDVERRPWRSGAVPVFVTPELDGWRLVFGNLDSAIGVDWDEWMDAVKRLSAHCGEAQMFFMDDVGGSDIWVVAERGRIRRRYAAESDPEWVGRPLPWEQLPASAAEFEEFDPDDEEAAGVPGEAGAADACVHLSLDPTAIGPHTDVRGHGWLALTEPGVGHEGLGA